MSKEITPAEAHKRIRICKRRLRNLALGSLFAFSLMVAAMLMPFGPGTEAYHHDLVSSTPTIAKVVFGVVSLSALLSFVEILQCRPIAEREPVERPVMGTRERTRDGKSQ